MLEQPYKLAIAEDDLDVSQTLIDYIEDLFPRVFNIRSFQDPNQALEVIRTRAFEADMIMTDLRMPGKFGDSLLNEIREFHPGILSVIITGFPSFPVMMSAHRDGTHGFLIKPFDQEDVKRIIDPCLQLLDNWVSVLRKYSEIKSF